MTEPQPSPYPGDTTGDAVVSSVLRREYRDVLGRPLKGAVKIRLGDAVSGVEVPLVDGVLTVGLEPGRYRLLGTLTDDEGKPYYNTETVIL